jgi:hypothetical protein
MDLSDRDEHPIGRQQRQEAVDGLLDESSWTEKRDKWFRDAIGAQGPEAFAPATGHDNGVDVGHGIFLDKRAKKLIVKDGPIFAYAKEFAGDFDPGYRTLTHVSRITRLVETIGSRHVF